jgi:hypothetical protein
MLEAITYTSFPSKYEKFLTKKAKCSISSDQDTMWFNSTGNQIEWSARTHAEAGTLFIFAMLNNSTELTAGISLGRLNDFLCPVLRLERKKDPPIQTFNK